VNSLGMQFGLWFEPEMINPDSALYHRHSDWVLGASDQLLGRHQMVLNLALPDVRDYLYDCIAQLLNDYNIGYIKWDHNRVLPLADAAQTHGTYDLLDRLQATFPNVEIETCSSGGGRIDFGILERTQRVWLSDSNDALERSRIQHNAALFLPSVVTGSHIGPRSCHTSGRIFDIRYRAWVAAQRHMGFEMDPRELTNAEAEILIEVTNWYKDNRNWLAQADILRLDSSDPAVIAEMQLSRDGHKFVIFSNQADTSAQINRRPLRLTQLEPLARYKLILRDRDQVNHLSRSNPLLKTKPLEVSGTWLMLHGINLPWAFPGTIWVVEGEKI
jgi:alpha-galactosidase